MKALFTSGNSFLSQAIRRIAGARVSNVGLEFQPGLVVYSHLRRIRISTLDHFLLKYKLIHIIDIPESYNMRQVLIKYEESQDVKKFSCTEFITEVLFNKADMDITPFQLYIKLIKEFHK